MRGTKSNYKLTINVMKALSWTRRNNNPGMEKSTMQKILLRFVAPVPQLEHELLSDQARKVLAKEEIA